MTDPLLSIVTISYNQGRFLEEAINSVLSQTYGRIEYIVFDGGSTDESIAIIERYRDSLAHVHVGPDQGPAAALNAGFGLAEGDIQAYLNSDDLLLPNAASTWVETFGRNPTVDIVYGDILIIDEEGKPSHLPKRCVSRFLAGPFSLRRLAAGAAVIPQQASAWKRDVFEHIGGFVEENRTCWDYEFFADAALAGFRFKRVPKTLGRFRVHGESISGTNRDQQQREADHARIAAKWQNATVTISPFERAYLLRSSQLARAFRYATTSRPRS